MESNPSNQLILGRQKEVISHETVVRKYSESVRAGVMMESPFTPAEEELMELWSRTDMRAFEYSMRSVAETGLPLRVLTMTKRSRVALYAVAAYWKLRVLTRPNHGSSYKGRHGNWRGLQLKDVYVCRPPPPYEPPTTTLVDLRNRWTHVRSTGSSRPKWKLRCEGEVVLPLASGETTAFSRHELPADIVAFILSLLPSVGDLARCRRVCRKWNEIAEDRQSIWRAHLETLLDLSVPELKLAKMKQTGGNARAALRHFLLTHKNGLVCKDAKCLHLYHTHGGAVPHDKETQEVFVQVASPNGKKKKRLCGYMLR